MRSLILIQTLSLMLCSAVAHADDTRRHLVHLSSEAHDGREVGTAGHDLARDYIQKTFEEAGLSPGGVDGSWLIPVSVVRRSRPALETVFRVGDRVLTRGVEYSLASFTDEVTFDSTPVFVGYGLSAAQAGWDDYAGVDVTDRIVLAFDGAPPSVADALDDDDAYLLSLESKAAVALAAGAQAIIFVNDPRSHGDRGEQRPDELPAIRPVLPLRGIGVAMMTARHAAKLFGDAGLELQQYQDLLDEGRPVSVEPSVNISGHLRLNREVVEAHNVVGVLPGKTNGAPIALGAHYDHLGHEGPGSLHNGPETLHPGADDNASGVAVLLGTAASLSGRPQLERSILFVATTGEELGLRGARQAAHVLRGAEPGVYVNLDMVGRLREDVVHGFGLAEATELAATSKTLAQVQGLELAVHPLDGSDSDHLAFADRGWTAMSFSTGRHRDYHLPSDTVDQIEWKGLARIEKFVQSLLAELASR